MKKKLILLGVYVLLIGTIVCSLVLAKKEKEDKNIQLPESLKAALMQMHPGAAIEEAQKAEEGCKVYEVELVLADGSEIEITIAADGTVMEAENEMNTADLPFDVSSLLPANTEVKEVKREVHYAAFVPAALPEAETTYEVLAIIGGKKVEITLAPDGTILKKESKNEEEEKCHKKGQKGKEDDEDEQTVAFDQLPASVQTALMAAAKGGTIKEIDLEDGIYEADVLINGQETEIKIAPDGKILAKKIEADDDENDHEDND
ncbi:MAG TPA: hypothetical protein PK525_12305 [Anaerohalosphaeraceae bacterium]|nr:hypothetical protein [Anaerohalosphaeraceae bacterium]HRT24641.1 hypothetical protein [Anaerohalosphaeraceae bacterium]HRU15982.1 hypothetical protein [Anaerohalosphaeraceae bacterium]